LLYVVFQIKYEDKDKDEGRGGLVTRVEIRKGEGGGVYNIS
jgi:hypothetical protein